MKLQTPTLALLAFAGVFFSCSAAEDPVTQARREAIEAHDRAVLINDHWIRDPYIILGPDESYYLTGTTLENEEDGIIGIPLWRSEDLVTWEKLPRLWELSDSEWLHTRKPRDTTRPLLVWAPEIHFHNGKWVIIHTTNARTANILITEGPELVPPLKETMKEAFGHRHDPYFYFEEGQPWLVWGNTFIARMSRDLTTYLDEPIRVEPEDRRIGHEGSAIYKIGEKYVIFGTAWSTDKPRQGTYNLYYTTADEITGPYGPRRFAGRCLGHGTPFQDKQGRWWCTAFFNANVPPAPHEELMQPEVAETAHTMNQRGTTLVPLEVEVLPDGDISVRAKDPRYAIPGPEEVQKFNLSATGS